MQLLGRLGDKMNLGIILITLIGLLVIYLMVFHAPKPDKLYSSDQITELEELQCYLEKEGICTYIKGGHTHSLQLPVDSANRNPSLHVADVRDLKRAVALLKELDL